MYEIRDDSTTLYSSNHYEDFSKRKKDLNSLIGHFNYYHYKEDKNND